MGYDGCMNDIDCKLADILTDEKFRTQLNRLEKISEFSDHLDLLPKHKKMLINRVEKIKKIARNFG